jgi:hypothetical protein
MEETKISSDAFERWLSAFREVRHVSPAAPEHNVLQQADWELRRLARDAEARQWAFVKERRRRAGAIISAPDRPATDAAGE